jgi:bifunctional enzyme CysN/CysC
LKGDNVVRYSDSMSWFEGETLLEYLESATVSSRYLQELRLPVQYVIRSGPDYRGYAGQIASGSLNRGDEVLILPCGLRARVHSIDSFEGALESAHAPTSVTVRFDGHFDVGRGSMLVSVSSPPIASQNIRATLIWMSESPLKLQAPYIMKHTTQQVCGKVSRVLSALDIGSLEEAPATELQLNDIGTVELETHCPIFFDPYEANRTTGSFILIDPITNLTVGAGMISGSGVRAVDDVHGKPSSSGLTLWFTGLSSAGKTTISHAVYERLWAMGHKVELLDGDVVRRHLSKDLGFTEHDRNENIRRIGFIAELLTRNGVIAIVSTISPYRSIRDELRSRIGAFVEVYVNAPLAVCEQRDVKGLYQKARAGLLPRFTGIDDPYEPPLNPEIECRTDRETLAESADKVIAYLQSRLGVKWKFSLAY